MALPSPSRWNKSIGGPLRATRLASLPPMDLGPCEFAERTSTHTPGVGMGYHSPTKASAEGGRDVGFPFSSRPLLAEEGRDARSWLLVRALGGGGPMLTSNR